MYTFSRIVQILHHCFHHTHSIKSQTFKCGTPSPQGGIYKCRRDCVSPWACVKKGIIACLHAETCGLHKMLVFYKLHMILLSDSELQTFDRLLCHLWTAASVVPFDCLFILEATFTRPRTAVHLSHPRMCSVSFGRNKQAVVVRPLKVIV